MAEQRKDLYPKVEHQIRRCGSLEDTCRVSFIKGQQVAIWTKEKTALPLLILQFGSEGRAALSNVLC